MNEILITRWVAPRSALTRGIAIIANLVIDRSPNCPMLPNLPKLPITPTLPELVAALAANHQAVLEAPPGAGKTTLVPLALLNQEWLKRRKIVMLEPRRMAARAAAERMASLLGEKVGRTVGYRVRQEVRVSDDTRIEVITGGILSRWLQDDPALEGVGVVIFDEFHERHLDSDLGLALCLQSRELFREADQPLKLLVMSATLNGVAVAQLLGEAPIIRSQGKSFPVSIVYGRSMSLTDSIAPVTAKTVLSALREEHGSILVFLPGQGEIRQVMRELDGRIPDNVELAPLYGGLSLDEQRKAIAPAQGEAVGQARRKVVLATDIAESSLTIEGVRVVIDAGRTREPAFDPNSGMTRLTTKRVSQASSVQRCGRAGRLEAGVCYRLWSKEQQQQLAPYSTPEIVQADLAPLALQLLNWGIEHPRELLWLDPPPEAAFQQALELLANLGAVTLNSPGHWQLTTHGRSMNDFPAHPRLAHLLLCAQQRDLLPLGSRLAALLSEPLRGDTTADICYLLGLLSGDTPCPGRYRDWCNRTRKQARTFETLSTNNTQQLERISDEDAAGYLLSCAYPDRIARRRAGQYGVYQLSNGRSATLAEGETLANVEWLACAEVSGFTGNKADRITMATALNPELLEGPLANLTSTKDVMEWDRQSNRFIAERHELIGQLIVSKQKIDQPSSEIKIPALLNFVRQQGLTLLPWNDELRQWQARVQLVYMTVKDEAENPWPDVSDSGLLQQLDGWLTPYLTEITRLSDFQQLPLKEILESLLPWPLQQRLEELAPRALTVPSGSRITIDYLQTPPVLAVKLQEMFGCEETPRIARGKVALMVHLLSPARRPLQITQDLAGFWRGSYNEVKKEMKGRYPKHPWPDDPLQALPSKHVKHRIVR